MHASEWDQGESSAPPASTETLQLSQKKKRIEESDSSKSSNSSSDSSDSDSSKSDSSDEEIYDFSNAAKPNPTLLPLDQHPKTKTVYVSKPCGKDGSVRRLLPAILQREKCGDIFNYIADLVKIPKSKIYITYPVRTSKKKKKAITVDSNSSEEVLKSMYQQLEETSTLRVYRTAPVKSKPGEELFRKFMKEKFVSKRTYMIFEDHEQILETFIDRIFVIRCFLGNSISINLLSPGKFLCPINTCRDIVNLKHFNDYGYIRAHLIKHMMAKVRGADVLLNRFNYVTSAQWLNRNKFEDVDRLIESLSSTINEGVSLSLDNVSLFIPLASDNFKGKKQMMDESIVKKMIEFDPTALDSLPPLQTPRPITHYFSSV